MIIASHFEHTFTQTIIHKPNQHLLKDALWIDLINPTPEEEELIERNLEFDVPTREEMREIEISSRLYKENDILFMTATMIAKAESNAPKQDAVTFILTKKQLITLRYIEPQAFKLFNNRLSKIPPFTNPASLLTELLDVTVDRLADILEMINHQLELISKRIFHYTSSKNHNYQKLLQQVGVNGELCSKIVESLVAFHRLIPFFEQSTVIQMNAEDKTRLHALNKDITSLNDHALFLSNKISFLLEATLGMVQIEQNAIIKIFSVAAVIFLPPTLIASMYGMNFRHMPELAWQYGYLFAVSLMLLASWLPYKYFKYKKWL